MTFWIWGIWLDGIDGLSDFTNENQWKSTKQWTSMKMFGETFRNHSETAPKRFRNGSEPVPKRFRNGSELVPKQFRNNSETVPEQLRHISETAPKRFRNWAEIVPKLFRNNSEHCSEQRSEPLFGICVRNVRNVRNMFGAFGTTFGANIGSWWAMADPFRPNLMLFGL